VATKKTGVSSEPDDKGWATDGYELQAPPDPSASLGDSDILRGDGRDQDPIDRAKGRKGFQFGEREPLESDFPTHRKQ
jgi:hypothetical protein